ncbi:MAG: beta-ketoacyl synthase, partial [Gemmatimonadetes bacterium]|nr:beta-ketoacyl synthase [Gemmatimonadota bacterium]
ARVFVEVGPKRALTGFVQDVLGDRDEARWLFTNHPKMGDRGSFNRCLWGLYAAGHGLARDAVENASGGLPPYDALGRIFADAIERGMALLSGPASPTSAPDTAQQAPDPAPARPPATVVVTGAALGLPGAPRLFDDANVARILHGSTLLEAIPGDIRDAMAGMGINRLVKGADGTASFRSIDDPADVIKLAGRAGAFDLAEEFGIRPERVQALNRTTQLAMAAGLDALRDAGLPLVQRYRTTSKGTQLPDGWRLPDALRDDTGIIFASAFPGLDVALKDARRKALQDARTEHLESLRELRSEAMGAGDEARVADLSERIARLTERMEAERFEFDRRYLFQLLSMGHSQFAEEIGARGPNTQINSACASTTQALGLAQDWIRAGRCRRVVIIAADDVTEDGVLEWIGSGFLATGAAATDEAVEDAALPFDRRRHGMLIGMGAAALVVEHEEAAAERGLRPICRVLATATANSAFHGTRLDVDHIAGVMDDLVTAAERRGGIDRAALAPQLVFMSHETYTPARGGSAAAEVHALRRVFGDAADTVVIANTKGFTGHPMGVGVEDVVVVKALETGVVPPVPNFREVDPELGLLNLSKGGEYPVRYALRLGAGFGSQVSMSLLAWIPGTSEARPAPDALGFDTRLDDRRRFEGWLAEVSGDPDPELEVQQHRLRVVDRRMAAAVAASAAPAESAPAGSPVDAPTEAAL